MLLSQIVNPPFNQAQLHVHLSMFVSSIDYGVQATRVVREIYRANADLVAQIDKALFRQLAEELARSDRDPFCMVSRPLASSLWCLICRGVQQRSARTALTSRIRQSNGSLCGLYS